MSGSLGQKTRQERRTHVTNDTDIDRERGAQTGHKKTRCRCIPCLILFGWEERNILLPDNKERSFFLPLSLSLFSRLTIYYLFITSFGCVFSPSSFSLPSFFGCCRVTTTTVKGEKRKSIESDRKEGRRTSLKAIFLYRQTMTQKEVQTEKCSKEILTSKNMHECKFKSGEGVACFSFLSVPSMTAE